MKSFKRILSLICVLATLVLLIQAPSANAYDYQTYLEFNEKYYDTLEEEDLHEYHFTLNHKTNITIDFESAMYADVDIYKYDSYWDEYEQYKSFSDTTSLFNTVTLKKGVYCIALWRWDDYDEDYYDCDCCWEDCEWDEDCTCGCVDCIANQQPDSSWNDGYNYTLEVMVDYANKIKFETKKITMKPGKTKTLNIKTVPNFCYVEDLYWYSSNNKVATVNQNGKVTTKAWGKTTITAESDSGDTATCTIIVKNDKKTIKMHAGSTLNLPKINGKKQSGWKSTNTSIATGGSKVTGKSSGTTTLYKKIGGVTYYCKIKVINPYTLLAKGKEKIKNDLYYPSYFDPQTAWRGYWHDGDPVVVLKYRGKTLGGWMRTVYAVIWYKGSKVTYTDWDYMPSSSSFKKKVKL